MNWYIEVLKNYAVFNGRARRKEYWMFFLFNVIIAIGLGVISVIPKVGSLGSVIANIYCLATLIPGIAVAIRRMHDTGRSGWWLLMGLIPFVGAIVLLVFLVQDSQPGENEFGPNPKETGI